MSKSQSVKKRMTLKDLNTWTALIWASSEGHSQRVALIKAVRDRTQDTN